MFHIPFGNKNAHTHTFSTFIAVVALSFVIILVDGLFFVVIYHVGAISGILRVIHLLMIDDEIHTLIYQRLIATYHENGGMRSFYLIIYKVYALLAQFFCLEISIITLGILSGFDGFWLRSNLAVAHILARDGSRERSQLVLLQINLHLFALLIYIFVALGDGTTGSQEFLIEIFLAFVFENLPCDGV